MALTKRDLEQIGELLEQQSNDFGELIRGTVIPPIEELQKSTKELQKSVDSIERELAKKDDRLDDHGRRIERLERDVPDLKAS